MEENRQTEENVVTSEPVEPEVNNEPAAEILTDRDVKTDEQIEDRLQSQHEQKKEETIEPLNLEPEPPKVEEKKQDSYKKIASDDSQFLNWNAQVIKDGMFEFSEVKNQIKEKSGENLAKSKVLMNRNKSIEVETIEDSHKKSAQIRKSKLQQERNPLQKSDLKVSRTLGSHKKQILVRQREDLPKMLMFLKPLHIVFVHFCKDNNLSAIKSTLFEDKPKVMEEMNLHKWMVFCKQFQIIDKLYQLRTQDKSVLLSENKCSMEAQQIKVRALKDVEKKLIDIFRAVNESKANIGYPRFVEGVSLIYDQFKEVYPLREQGGINRFVEECLFCSSEKECLKKLSCLKFTHNTPHISYDKTPWSEMKSLQNKSRLNISRQRSKQNLGKSQSSKGKFGSIDQLRLNPVLSQAKKTMKTHKNMNNYASKQELKKHKLKIGQNSERDESGLKKRMIKDFQKHEDEILDTFFKIQTKKISFPSLH